MVDLAGHVAFGLMFSLPAWFIWNGRSSVVFITLAGIASLLPDIDLWLVKLFPARVHHHGVTHTVLFVAIMSVVGAVIIAGLFTDRIDEWIESERFDRRRLFVFSFLGLLSGGLSHVFADMLSAPDVSTPIEPLWPVVQGSWGIDLVWYDANWINTWFLLVMIVVHLAVAYLTTPADHRPRLLPL